MLHDVISQYVEIIWNMIVHVKPYVTHLLWALLAMDVVFLGINMASGKASEPGHIIERLLVMGVLVYVVTNFTQLAVQFKDSFVKILGAGSINVPGFDSTIYHNPSQIVSWAHSNLIAPMNEAIKHLDDAYTPPKFSIGDMGNWLNASTAHMMDVWNVRLMFNILFIGVLLAFTIIAVQMTVAIIEFYLVLLFALCLVPFVAWQPLRFIGTRAFSAVIAQGLRLGIIVSIISLGMRVMNNVNHSIFNDILSWGKNSIDVQNQLDLSVLGLILGSCAVLVFLSIQVPSLAMALISGTPALSASGFGQNMMGIAAIGMAAVGGFRALASGPRQESSSPQSSTASSSSTPSPASSTTSISSTPTTGGAGAQSMFQAPPAALPGGGGGSGAGVAVLVNPVSHPGGPSSGTAAAPADRMFQPISTPSKPTNNNGVFGKN